MLIHRYHVLCSCGSCRIVSHHCCVCRENQNVVLMTDEMSHLVTEVMRDWLMDLVLLLLVLTQQQRYDVEIVNKSAVFLSFLRRCWLAQGMACDQ